MYHVTLPIVDQGDVSTRHFASFRDDGEAMGKLRYWFQDRAYLSSIRLVSRVPASDGKAEHFTFSVPKWNHADSQPSEAWTVIETFGSYDAAIAYGKTLFDIDANGWLQVIHPYAGYQIPHYRNISSMAGSHEFPLHAQIQGINSQDPRGVTLYHQIPGIPATGVFIPESALWAVRDVIEDFMVALEENPES